MPRLVQTATRAAPPDDRVQRHGGIVAAAKARNVPVQTANKQKLGQLARDSSHQGVALEVRPYVYSDVTEMLALAHRRGKSLFC